MKQIVKQKVYYFIMAFFVTIALCWANRSYIVKSAEIPPEVKIVYFYNNPCASCDEETKFKEKFSRIVGASEDVKVSLQIYNIFHVNESELVKEYYKRFGVLEEKQNTPILFIGDSYLSGNDEIEGSLKTEFVKAKEQAASALTGNISTNTKSIDKTAVGKSRINMKNDDSTIVYFHVTACSSCEKVREYLDRIDKKYIVSIEGKEINSNLIIKDYNIADLENLELIKKYFQVYGVQDSEQKVPIIFMRDTYLSGEDSIKQELVNRIKEGKGVGMTELNSNGSHQDKKALNGYRMAGAFLTGLINGFNPCSVSMFLFFLSLIVVRNINVLKLGFSFIAGKFITFFLLGTLFFSIFVKLNINWLETVVKAFTLVIVLILIILNIWDFFAAKNEKYNNIKLQLPSALRKYNHRWIKKVSSLKNNRLLFIVSFLLGMIIAIGEFLCTGQVYLATIVYAIRNTGSFNFEAAAYFVLYGLVFIAPLILLMLIIHRGREIFDISEIFRNKMHIVKLINAIFFTLFGLVMLFWF